jgi:hypothetical protein
MADEEDEHRLTRLQAADLEREDFVRHWSLRVRHINNLVKLAFGIGVTFIAVAAKALNWGRLHLKWGEALLYTGRRGEAENQFAIAWNLDLSASDGAALARVRANHG